MEKLWIKQKQKHNVDMNKDISATIKLPAVTKYWPSHGNYTIHIRTMKIIKY